MPMPNWMMDKEGVKHIEIEGLDDKRQIMTVFGGTLTGKLLPKQLVHTYIRAIQLSVTLISSSLMTGILLILTTSGVMELQ